MNVLIIFDLIPEEQKRAIVSMTEVEYNYFKLANNHYINITDCSIAEGVTLVINQAFSEGNADDLEYCETDKQRQYCGKWKSDLENQDLVTVDKLIVCGFVL